MLIRRELAGDETAIDEVHADAFADPERDPVEPGLVAELRRSDAWIPRLSLLACLDEAVVGHVCCTRGTLLPGEHPVLALGPIGVRKGHQGRRIGTALMYAALGAADALDERLVVLLGHPSYYPRFGFRPAADLGIQPEVPEWAPAFQAMPLTGYRPDLRGRFRYPQPFYDV